MCLGEDNMRHCSFGAHCACRSVATLLFPAGCGAGADRAGGRERDREAEALRA